MDIKEYRMHCVSVKKFEFYFMWVNIPLGDLMKVWQYLTYIF